MAALISVGRADDLDWLRSVDRHVPEAWIRRCLALDEYLIARREGHAAGVLRHSLFWGVIPFMDFVFVEESSRGQRIGSALFEVWQRTMRERGAQMLMTSSMADELEPQAWHRRNGFSPAGSLNFGRFQPAPEVFFMKPL